MSKKKTSTIRMNFGNADPAQIANLSARKARAQSLRDQVDAIERKIDQLLSLKNWSLVGDSGPALVTAPATPEPKQ